MKRILLILIFGTIGSALGMQQEQVSPRSQLAVERDLKAIAHESASGQNSDIYSRWRLWSGIRLGITDKWAAQAGRCELEGNGGIAPENRHILVPLSFKHKMLKAAEECDVEALEKLKAEADRIPELANKGNKLKDALADLTQLIKSNKPDIENLVSHVIGQGPHADPASYNKLLAKIAGEDENFKSYVEKVIAEQNIQKQLEQLQQNIKSESGVCPNCDVEKQWKRWMLLHEVSKQRSQAGVKDAQEYLAWICEEIEKIEKIQRVDENRPDRNIVGDRHMTDEEVATILWNMEARVGIERTRWFNYQDEYAQLSKEDYKKRDEAISVAYKRVDAQLKRFGLMRRLASSEVTQSSDPKIPIVKSAKAPATPKRSNAWFSGISGWFTRPVKVTVAALALVSLLFLYKKYSGRSLTASAR